MTDSRYAPPLASVADVHGSQRTPKSVRRACQLFVVSWLLGFAEVAGPFELPPSARSWAFVIGAGAVVVALVFVTVWLIFNVYRGRNWARWTFLLLLAPSVVLGAIEFPGQMAQSPFQAAVGIITSALDVLTCWLLFFGTGASNYFRRGTPGLRGAGES